MRKAKRNTLIFMAIMVVSSLISSISLLSLAITPVSHDLTGLEFVLGDMEYAEGNDYGAIYSIDGTRIVTDKDEHYSVVQGYSEVIGDESGGMIYKLRPILLANSSEINKKHRMGNSIVSTIHSSGQTAAHAALSEYEDDVDASICVVLKDGTVLVSATNASYSSEAFTNAGEYKDAYNNYNDMPSPKGSSFKPLVYRMLIGHMDELSEGMSFLGESFIDVSEVMVNGSDVHNWDYSNQYNYDILMDNGIFSRKCSLSKLLQYSSNTAPIRLTQDIGFKKSYQYMNTLYQLNRSLNTEINSLAIEVPSENRLPYFFFGQDASIPAIRMAQLYNYCISGEFYVPFYCASVIDPEYNTIYMATPKPVDEYTMDINVRYDILVKGLIDTFESYLDTNLMCSFSEDILYSKRILAKSGTAERGDGTENRVLMMTILNEDRSDVICTACICVNGTGYTITNAHFIEKLLYVLESIEII